MPDFGLLQGGTQLNPNALAQGMQQGMGIVQFQQQQQDRQTAMAEKAAAVEAAKAKAIEDAKRNMYQMQRFAEVAKAPTPDALVSLQIEFPEAAQKLTEAHKALSSNEQKANLGLAQRVYAAANANDVNLSIDLLKNAAEAKRNAGDEKGAKALEENARLLLENPDEAKATIGLFVAEAMGPTEFLKTFQGLQTADADLVKAQAEAGIKATQAKYEEKKILADLGYTDAQKNRLYAQTKNDAARLALDEKRLLMDQIARQEELRAKMGELPEGVRKDIDAAVADGSKAKLQAVAATELAKKFRQYSKEAGESWTSMTSSGLRARAGETLAAWTGFEDDVSAMRKQYDALVASQVIANLPPGTASDTDIALVRGGFPDSTARPEQVANFLDAMARVQRDTESQKRTESDYLAANRSFAPARADIVVNGVTIPAGTSFADASAIIYASKAPKKPAGSAPLAPADLQSRSRFTR